MAKNKKGFRLFYTKLLFSFIFFIIIPTTVLGLVFYFNSANKVNDFFIEKYSRQANNISKNSKYIFSSIENELIAILHSNEVKDYKHMESPGMYVNELLNITEVLKNAKSKHEVIKSIYFYDTESNHIITSTNSTYDFNDFYDKDWLDKIDNANQISRLSPRLDMDNNVNDKVTYYVIPKPVITIVSPREHGKVIVINLSIDKLYRILGIIDENFIILDQNNNIIVANEENKLNTNFNIKELNLSKKGKQFFDNKNYYFTSPLDYNDYQCAIVIPSQYLSNNIRSGKVYISLLCFLLISISLIIAFVILQIVYSPFQELILDIIKFSANIKNMEDKDIKDELFIIKDSFDKINRDKIELQTKLNKYRRTIRNKIFQDFVEEKVSFDRFISSYNDIKIDVEMEVYKIIILSCNTTDSPKVAITMVELNRLQGIETVDTYINNIASGVFKHLEKDTYLVFIGAKDLNEINTIQLEIEKTINNNFDTILFIGESSTFNEIYMMPNAYQEAYSAFYHAQFFCKESGKVSYKEICNRKEQDFIYPVNPEDALIRSILQKDKALAKDNIASIISAVVDNNSTSIHTASFVFNRIQSILSKEFNLKEICGLDLHKDMVTIDKASTMEKYLEELSFAIIDHMLSDSKQENVYCTMVKDFIEKHYMEDISVSCIADYINISYPYLSKVFKDNTNTNIVDYFNMYRIKKAKEELLNTSSSIALISKSVGYNNPQSFQRLFKKFEGITPGEYRKLYSNTIIH